MKSNHSSSCSQDIIIAAARLVLDDFVFLSGVLCANADAAALFVGTPCVVVLYHICLRVCAPDYALKAGANILMIVLGHWLTASLHTGVGQRADESATIKALWGEAALTRHPHTGLYGSMQASCPCAAQPGVVEHAAAGEILCPLSLLVLLLARCWVPVRVAVLSDNTWC